MSNYCIFVQDIKTGEKFRSSEEFRKGVECDGYFLLTVKRAGGELESSAGAVLNTSIEELSKILRERDSEPAVIIRMAAAIAEGHEKANEIRREAKMAKRAEGISRALAKAFGVQSEQEGDE